jgi:hypothetical protein
MKMHNFSLDYYATVGQHGSVPLPTYIAHHDADVQYKEAIKEAQSFAKREKALYRRQPIRVNKTEMVEISPIYPERRFAIIHMTEEYLNYVKYGLPVNAFNNETNREIYINAAEKCLATKRVVKGEFV